MGVTQRRRLDAELVRRKIASGRRQAAELIRDSRVLVSGAVAANAARLVAPGEPIEIVGPRPRFVGRGGEKLAAALERFSIDVAAKRALDVGASTGGFTDCLLAHKAASVVALDVGHGQLHERLRANDRVDVRERTNFRHVTLADFDDVPFSVITVDVSFISLRTIAPALQIVSADDADLLCLIKPQFEAGRREVSKGKGVVAGADIWNDVLESTVDALAARDAATMGIMTSPLTGADGNIEFLGWFRKRKAPTEIDTAGEIASAVAEAQEMFDSRNHRSKEAN